MGQRLGCVVLVIPGLITQSPDAIEAKLRDQVLVGPVGGQGAVNQSLFTCVVGHLPFPRGGELTGRVRVGARTHGEVLVEDDGRGTAATSTDRDRHRLDGKLAPTDCRDGRQLLGGVVVDHELPSLFPEDSHVRTGGRELAPSVVREVLQSPVCEESSRAATTLTS